MLRSTEEDFRGILDMLVDSIQDLKKILKSDGELGNINGNAAIKNAHGVVKMNKDLGKWHEDEDDFDSKTKDLEDYIEILTSFKTRGKVSAKVDTGEHQMDKYTCPVKRGITIAEPDEVQMYWGEFRSYVFKPKLENAKLRMRPYGRGIKEIRLGTYKPENLKAVTYV